MSIDMQAPPIWLLDVDGVINAVAPAWGVKPYRIWSPTTSTGQSYRLRYAAPLIDRIRAVHDSGLAEVRWCSTWNNDCAALGEVFGLHLLPAFMIERADDWRTVAGRKRLAAQHVLEREGRRLIWTDDVEVPFDWELSHATWCKDGQALLIRPKERVGLTPEHMDQIDRYIGRAPAAEEVAA